MWGRELSARPACSHAHGQAQRRMLRSISDRGFIRGVLKTAHGLVGSRPCPPAPGSRVRQAARLARPAPAPTVYRTSPGGASPRVERQCSVKPHQGLKQSSGWRLAAPMWFGEALRTSSAGAIQGSAQGREGARAARAGAARARARRRERASRALPRGSGCGW